MKCIGYRQKAYYKEVLKLGEQNSVLTKSSEFTEDEMGRIIHELSNVNSDLTEIIKQVAELQRDGTLKSLIEIATLIVAVKKAMTTDIVRKITVLIPDPDRIAVIEKVLEASMDAKKQVDSRNSKLGVGTMLRTLKDPDIQYILSYLIIFSKSFSRIIR